MNILIILSLPIYQHQRSFHAFVSSLISFSNVLSFSVYRSSSFLVKCILKYFILFDATVNEVNSFGVCCCYHFLLVLPLFHS